MRCHQCRTPRAQLWQGPSRRHCRALQHSCRHSRTLPPARAAEANNVVDTFFSIAGQQLDRNPDQIVSLLSDQVIDAAIASVKAGRQPEEAFDITLDTCMRAGVGRPAGVPFIDSFGVRTLKYAVVQHNEALSVMRLDDRRVVQRRRVVLDSGEVLVLTFHLALEPTIRAAYKGIASDLQWVLSRISGEWEALKDGPAQSMGPEAVLERQLVALRCRDIETVFSFASPANKQNSGPLDRFAAMLDSPVYRPLLDHLEAQVINMRHLDADKVMGLVKVQGNPLLVQSNSLDRHLYAWTITRQAGASQWLTDSVRAVPVAFLNSWPRT